MKDNTILSNIMRILDISGKELGMYIGLDPSAVSKWKTNKRKLPYKSIYGIKIAEYVLSDKFKEKKELLMEFLERYASGIIEESKPEQIERIRQLICKKNKIIVGESVEDCLAEYQTTVQVIVGDNSGFKQAMRMFHADVKRCKEGQSIILCDFGNIDWELTSEDVLNFQINEIKALSQEGHQIKIIDIISENYRSPEVLFRWFPIYMMHGIELYYVMDTLPQLQTGCIYTSEDGGAMVGLTMQKESASGAYVYYEDIRMKDYYRKSSEYFLHNATRMLRRIDIDDNLQMVNLLAENLSPAEVTYMINPVPTYINMSRKLLRKVLERNETAPEMIEHCLKTVQRRHELRKKCKYVQIYDIDRIEERLSKECCEMELLSIVTKQAVTMQKEDMIEQLKDIKEVVERGDMEIYLISFKEFGIFHKDISFTVQENRLFIAWNDRLYDTMIYSKEPTFIGGMALYTNEILKRIHPLYKNMDWTIKQLEKYIDSVKK